MAAVSCMIMLLSCGKQESNRFVFRSSEEAVAACHKELATLREVKRADISRLTTAVADWLSLQDSVYSFMARDTTIHLNTSLTTNYYTVSDSIREELVRIARLQPRSLHDVTYLKIHTAQGRAKMRASQDFKKVLRGKVPSRMGEHHQPVPWHLGGGDTWLWKDVLGHRAVHQAALCKGLRDGGI